MSKRAIRCIRRTVAAIAHSPKRKNGRRDLQLGTCGIQKAGGEWIRIARKVIFCARFSPRPRPAFGFPLRSPEIKINNIRLHTSLYYVFFFFFFCPNDTGSHRITPDALYNNNNNNIGIQYVRITLRISSQKHCVCTHADRIIQYVRPCESMRFIINIDWTAKETILSVLLALKQMRTTATGNKTALRTNITNLSLPSKPDSNTRQYHFSGALLLISTRTRW